MSRKFKVGDRVKCIHSINSTVEGKIGTIRYITDNGNVGVEFDDPRVNGHNLGGAKKSGRGWCSHRDNLQLVNEEKIVIYRKDNEVIAKDCITGKTAVAKCDPRDEFDFETGAKLALDRLYHKVNFKILGIKSSTGYMTKGKVYEFINGVTVWDDGRSSGHYNNIKSFFTQNESFRKIAIEIKDGDNIDELLKQYDPIEKGDMVTVIATEKTYPRYATWKGLKGYESHFVSEKLPVKNYVYKVINVRKHDNDRTDVALIQDMNTTQVFIIGIDGLKKVKEEV